MSASIPNVLSIAGSDPSGGAGIQADLKTFAALETYGMAALTALTAQNTRGVTGVHPVPVDFIRQQIDTVFEDIEVHAVKVGMVGSAGAVAAVAECLANHAPAAIIVDPVMVAKSGHRLIDDDAVRILRDRLLPLATLVTPNLPEAQVLLGDARPAADRPAMLEIGRRLQSMLGTTVVLKGGHLDDDGSPDLLVRDGGEDWFESERVETRSTHGTGCTLSSACAASLALTGELAESVGRAKVYLTEALKAADRLTVGHGHGPVDHFHRFR